MGMFDNYEPAEPIPCPVCGTPLDEWQGKDGPNDLVTWRQGSAAPVAGLGGTLDVDYDDERLPETFTIHSWCKTCSPRRPLVDAYCRCVDGVWSSTELIDPSRFEWRDGEWVPREASDTPDKMPHGHLLASTEPEKLLNNAAVELTELRVKLAELEQQTHDLRGDLAASQLLCADYDRDRQQLRRERNAAASTAYDGYWIWCDTDPNDLPSLSSDAIVLMRAEQLRTLLAGDGAKLAAVREVLKGRRCDCDPDPHNPFQADPSADPCLACRIAEVLGDV